MALSKYEFFDQKAQSWKPAWSLADDMEMKRMNHIIGWDFYRKR